MHTPQAASHSRWLRWRWKLCCLGVAVITYLAIWGALMLPGKDHGANFLFTAFPAAIFQFVLIDLARHGMHSRRKPPKPPL